MLTACSSESFQSLDQGQRKVIGSMRGLQGGSTSCLKFLFLALWSFCWKAHVLSSCWIFKHSRWPLKRKKTFQGLDMCSTLHTEVLTNEEDRMFYFKDAKGLSKEAPLEAFKISYVVLNICSFISTHSSWALDLCQTLCYILIDVIFYNFYKILETILFFFLWNNSLFPFCAYGIWGLKDNMSRISQIVAEIGAFQLQVPCSLFLL